MSILEIMGYDQMSILQEELRKCYNSGNTMSEAVGALTTYLDSMGLSMDDVAAVLGQDWVESATTATVVTDALKTSTKEADTALSDLEESATSAETVVETSTEAMATAAETVETSTDI